MKKIVILFMLILLLSILAFSQENESQKLTDKAFSLYQQGNFDEAISSAEKVVTNEMSLPNRNWQNVAMAMLNLVLLKKEHYWKLRKDAENKDISKEELEKNVNKRYEYIKNLPLDFQKIIDIYDKELKIENLQLATATIEFANFESRFFSDSTNMPFRNSDSLLKIEKLYLRGLKIRENLLGLDNEKTVSTIFSVAGFYERIADFEHSIPLYEQYIIAVEKKYGAKSEFLLPALRSKAFLLYSSEQENEAKSIVEQIETITGKKEPVLATSLDLSLRNKSDELKSLMENPDTITTYLKTQKWLLVHISIDEKGNVFEVNAENPQEKDIFGKNVKEKAERLVRSWKFIPFIYKGNTKKLKGIIWFPYLVKA